MSVEFTVSPPKAAVSENRHPFFTAVKYLLSTYCLLISSNCMRIGVPYAVFLSPVDRDEADGE